MAAVAAGAAIVGAGISIYGQVKGNQAQASAERANARFYQEQADFAEKAGDRELDIYKDQAAEFFGQQKSGFARAGVELQGSPLLALADSISRQQREEEAIQMDTAAKVREANLKGGLANKTAASLSNFANNALPASGTLLTAGAQAYGAYTKGR